jgi:hypothetical protein
MQSDLFGNCDDDDGVAVPDQSVVLDQDDQLERLPSKSLPTKNRLLEIVNLGSTGKIDNIDNLLDC